jgi:hypothetical protein
MKSEKYMFLDDELLSCSVMHCFNSNLAYPLNHVGHVGPH